MFGVMLDCSRNAVMKPTAVKRFIDYLAIMGYDALELYTEDTLRLPTEPYFGYLRGGYSAQELKDIEAYALSKGIELIPCVQTLAHFNALVKLPHYSDIVDVNDILLVDEPKTYELLEKLFDFLESTFISRKVNIGMDEAHLLGLGKFLDKHGYQNRFDILLRHLNRVYEIAKRHGFTCHMWSDMFFRLQNGGEYYAYKDGISKEIIAKIPQDMQLVYWDYYHPDKQTYDGMLSVHKTTDKEVWFAGGAWTWAGFAPFNRKAIHHTKVALESVRDNGVKNVLITLWGDNGKECSFFSALPALYASSQFMKGVFDEEVIKRGFKRDLGLEFDDFMLFELLNDTQKNKTEWDIENPCKSMLYNDCFLGSVDKDYELAGRVDYEKFTPLLDGAQSRAGEFAYIFKSLARLSSVMEIKAELGIKTRKAYKSGDKTAIKKLIKDYLETQKRLGLFYQSFRELWFKENKPHGWEVQDARLGGLMQRLKFCSERLEDFVSGKISRIEELEEEILPYSNNLLRNNYVCDVTTSRL